VEEKFKNHEYSVSGANRYKCKGVPQQEVKIKFVYKKDLLILILIWNAIWIKYLNQIALNESITSESVLK